MKKNKIITISLILALLFNLITPALPIFQAKQAVYAGANKEWRLVEQTADRTTHRLYIDGVPTNQYKSEFPAIPVIQNTDFEGLTADGWVQGVSTVYATARSTSTARDVTTNTLGLGQQWFSPDYYIWRGFLKFNTAAIGTDTITQVNLTLTCSADWSNTDFDIQVIKQDWSAQDPISDTNREAAYDNCLAGTQDDNIWRNTAGIVVNTPYISGNLSTSWVNKTGNTYYSLRSSRDYGNNAPTGIESVNLFTAENPTPAYRPILTVLHSAPLTNDSLTFTNPYQGSGNDATGDNSTEWNFRAVVSDPGGYTNLDTVKLRLADSSDNTTPYQDLEFTWTEATDAFSETGTDALSVATITSTGSDSSCASNTCTLDFKIKFNNNFASKSTNYNAELYTTNDGSGTDEDSYASFYQVKPWYASGEQYWISETQDAGSGKTYQPNRLTASWTLDGTDNIVPKFQVLGSSTGAFAGEETIYPAGAGTYYQDGGTYDINNGVELDISAQVTTAYRYWKTKAYIDTGTDGTDTPSIQDIRLRDFEPLLLQASNNQLVGIGTASPGYKLHVREPSSGASSRDTLFYLESSNFVSGASGPFMRYKIGSVDAGAIGGITETGNWPGALVFYTHTSTADNNLDSGLTEKMRITSAGNVGIGTTSPTVLFQVDKADSYVRFGNTLNGGLEYGFGNGDMYLGGDNTQAGNFYIKNSAGTVKVGINSDAASYFTGGNVGIGTTDPGSYKLSVAGTIRATGNNIINNSSPTTYYQDTDHRSAMVHVNSNRFYVLRGGGVNSLSWLSTGGYWPLEIDLENNNATFGGNLNADHMVIRNASEGLKIGPTQINAFGKLQLSSADFNAVAAIGHHTLSGSYNIFEVYNRGRSQDLFTVFSNGNAWLRGDLNAGSSRDYKKDITHLSTTDYENILAKLENLEIVNYRLKDESETSKLRLGIIAEDAPQEIVSEDGKSINISSYLSFLAASIKSQNEEIRNLRVEIEELKRIVEEN